jgi:hypothetical protein
MAETASRELARSHSVDFTATTATSFSPHGGDGGGQRRWDSALLVGASDARDPSLLSALLSFGRPGAGAGAGNKGSQPALMTFAAARVRRTLSKAGSLFSLAAGAIGSITTMTPLARRRETPSVLCKLCLQEAGSEDEYFMKGCSCVFCKEVIK